jgi:hypothetical protein
MTFRFPFLEDPVGERDELARPHPQRPGEAEQGQVAGVPGAALDAADLPQVREGLVRKFLLGPAQLDPLPPQRLSERRVLARARRAFAARRHPPDPFRRRFG